MIIKDYYYYYYIYCHEYIDIFMLTSVIILDIKHKNIYSTQTKPFLKKKKTKNILKKLLQALCQRVVDLRLAAAKTSHELEHAPGRRSSLESQSRWLKLFDFYERAHKGNLSFNGKISIGVPNLFNYWDIAINFLSISSHHRFQPSHLAYPYPYPYPCVKGHYPKSKGKLQMDASIHNETYSLWSK